MTTSNQTADFPDTDLFSPRPGPFSSVDPEQLGLARLGSQQLSNRLMAELDIAPTVVAAAMVETAATLMLICGGEFAVWQVVAKLLDGDGNNGQIHAVAKYQAANASPARSGRSAKCPTRRC